MSIAYSDTNTVLLLTAANVLYVGESNIFVYWSRIAWHNAGKEGGAKCAMQDVKGALLAKTRLLCCEMVPSW